jgi:hypothetical protein
MFILAFGFGISTICLLRGIHYELQIMKLPLKNNPNVFATFKMKNSSTKYTNLGFLDLIAFVITEVFLYFVPLILRLWKYEKSRYLDFNLKNILLGNDEENDFNTKPLFQFDGKYAISKIRVEDLSFGRNIFNYKTRPASLVSYRKIKTKSIEEKKLIQSDLQFLNSRPSQFIGMRTKSTGDFGGGIHAYKIPGAMEIINENNNNNNNRMKSCISRMKSCIDIPFKCICGKLTLIVMTLSCLLLFAILQWLNDGYSEDKYIADVLASDNIFKTIENKNKQHN